LKALAKKRNSARIHFVGRLSEDDLRCYLYAASVFAFPSVTKNEAFGVALAEAMYCYTPAVTFTIEGSGVNWVNLNGITGIEVSQKGNLNQVYAEALDKLVRDTSLQKEYSRAAHKRVAENFLIGHMVDAMEKVYQEL
jgi:glycosyltransferase